MVQTLGTLNCERSFVTPDTDAPLVTPMSVSYYELGLRERREGGGREEGELVEGY